MPSPRKPAKVAASANRDFELHRPSVHLPLHQRAGPDIRPGHKVALRQFLQVSAAQLAVDHETRQRPTRQTLLAIEE